jgi:HSP20 family protein
MSKNQIINSEKDWIGDYEGQLAIDVFQTEDSIVLKAPIAGVKSEDLEISITDEVINIKGERHHDEEVNTENYYAQECYWGAFSRSFILPVAVASEKAEATLKNGILIIKIPKLEKSRTKTIEIKTEFSEEN